jgi:hypothetical protein
MDRRWLVVRAWSDGRWRLEGAGFGDQVNQLLPRQALKLLRMDIGEQLLEDASVFLKRLRDLLDRPDGELSTRRALWGIRQAHLLDGICRWRGSV